VKNLQKLLQPIYPGQRLKTGSMRSAVSQLKTGEFIQRVGPGLYMRNPAVGDLDPSKMVLKDGKLVGAK